MNTKRGLMTGSTRAQIIMRNATVCNRWRDFQATRRYVWSPLSVAVLMNDGANGGKWAAGPSSANAQHCGWAKQSSGTSHWLHARWELSRNRRLSEKHFKQHGRKSQSAAAAVAEAVQALTERDRKFQDTQTESLLRFHNQSIKQPCTTKRSERVWQ